MPKVCRSSISRWASAASGEGQLAVDDRAVQASVADEPDDAVELLRRHRGGATPDDLQPLADHRPHVQGHHRRVERAARHEPAGRRERAEAPLEGRSEDRIEDDVGVELRDLLVVVGERLGAEVADAGVLRRARGRIDLGAEIAADVDRRLAGPARARLDEEDLALRELRIGEARPGRLVRDAEARGPRRVEGVRDGTDVVRLRDQELGVRPRGARNENAAAGVGARSGRVEARRVGGGRTRHLRCAALAQVVVVYGRRLDLHQHLPVRRLGIGNLLIAQDFGCAAFVDDDGMHTGLLSESFDRSYPQAFRSGSR